MSVDCPQSNRKSFFKSLASDIKLSREATKMTASQGSNPCETLECKTDNIDPACVSHAMHCLGLPRENDAPRAGFNFEQTPDDPAVLACHTRLGNLNMRQDRSRLCVDKNSVCAHLVDDHCNTSVAVVAFVETRINKATYFVIKSGGQVLASFLMRTIRLTRFWGVRSSTERIVSITMPDYVSDGNDAVYLKLDCRECLDRLACMTGFNLE